ncbi:MAG: hypothetical protein LPJ89_03885 [Hymenobacteraceae bacterium]|nr:hypothetical protein [Hymenobacteraceae bacterium]MDX5395452.1 hypothetical protein [Hymenobacteraceae bacterium]MDX5442905.1 hypothetical protein [Hymenobacteraceae bacterium]MDX5511501.1 hypothetical protein [Hymenobacteraceae bacterium]
MRSELTLVFEENDETLHWLFNILVYAHHVSDDNAKRMMEPMLQEYLTKQSYEQAMKLDKAQLDEDKLINDHLNHGLVKFKPGQVIVVGEKIKALVYMIEQAGSMMEEADDETISLQVRDLFKGHDKVLDRMKEATLKALEKAGARGAKIEKFSFDS